LARELARLGKQTILIDANLHAPNIAVHFPPALSTHIPTSPDQAWSGLRGSVADVLSGARRAAEVLTPTSDDGLRYIAGASAAGGLAPPLNLEAADRFTAELAALSRQVDVILIDAGHGMNPWVDRLWQLACEVLVTAPPSAQGLLDAYAVAKLSQHHLHDAKLRLLVNRAHDQHEARSLAHRFAETCQRFLNIRAKPAASLPVFEAREGATAGSPSSAKRVHGDHDSNSFHRAVRLLAADLTAELRAVALRLIRPTQPSVLVGELHPIRNLSQRHGGAEEDPKYMT
jgi:MinD-like ATPase involved in chromosome partitioning or flagellar assembly